MLGIHVAAYMDRSNTTRAPRDRKAPVGFVGFFVGSKGPKDPSTTWSHHVVRNSSTRGAKGQESHIGYSLVHAAYNHHHHPRVPLKEASK